MPLAPAFPFRVFASGPSVKKEEWLKLRVLIVDDEPLGRERIRTLLREDAEVEVVGESADGRQAVAAVERLKPDLVFLDVQMPEMDGFAVLDSMRKGIFQRLFS